MICPPVGWWLADHDQFLPLEPGHLMLSNPATTQPGTQSAQGTQSGIKVPFPEVTARNLGKSGPIEGGGDSGCIRPLSPAVAYRFAPDPISKKIKIQQKISFFFLCFFRFLPHLKQLRRGVYALSAANGGLMSPSIRRFVAYYRVSTSAKAQRLGTGAQKAAVLAFINGNVSCSRVYGG